jgi:hypothetical protein
VKLNDAQKKILKAEFDAMDTNKSGSLQRDEVRVFPSSLCCPVVRVLRSRARRVA